MPTIDEKRVYDDTVGHETVYVAAAAGVAAVSVSGDFIGEFSLAHRCSARDVSGGGGRLAVATDEDVLAYDGETLDATGFGPAVAVGFDDDTPLAADPDGGVHRLGDGDWQTVGAADSAVRAIDGDLVAAASGVYQVGDGLQHVGLDDVHDVAVEGFLAATGDGLYRLGNGWLDERDGDFRMVASDGERAHAATSDTLYERSDGGWTSVETPVAEPVVGVAYGDAVYAVTESGTFLADAGDGWRTRSLGLPDVCGLVIG